jgi:hypothetical protein
MLFYRWVRARGGDGEAGAPDDGRSTADPKDPEVVGSTEDPDMGTANPETPSVSRGEPCMSGVWSIEDPRVAISGSIVGGEKPLEAATTLLSDRPAGPERADACSGGGGFEVDVGVQSKADAGAVCPGEASPGHSPGFAVTPRSDAYYSTAVSGKQGAPWSNMERSSTRSTWEESCKVQDCNKALVDLGT